MPVFDFKCCSCEKTFEAFVYDRNQEIFDCKVCGSHAFKQFSPPGSPTSACKDDATWIPDVLEVVDKQSAKPHVRKFLESPTRSNYQAWMKGEGLRPMEENEKPRKPDQESFIKEMTEKVFWEHRKDSMIIIS